MSELLAERDDKVLHLTINREDKRNSLSREVLQGLLDGVRSAAGDDAVTVVVVSSAGGKVFSAGADPSVMAARAARVGEHERGGLPQDLVVANRARPKPGVAEGQ